MPKVKPGESRRKYVNRATKFMIKKEGLTPKRATAQAHGMYDQYLKNKRK